MTEWLGWHFLCISRKLKYEPYTTVNPGDTLMMNPPIELCKRGFHASERAIDALMYAPGPIVCRVRLSGDLRHGKYKSVVTQRTVLWMFDATEILHELACRYAYDALIAERERGRKIDTRSWAGIEAKRKWLKGEITDAELAAARDAAESAAWVAAEYAAWAAAESASEYAARDAAEYAAESAIRSAWAASEYAAWFAERSTQNALLESRLFESAHQRGVHQ